MLKRLSTWWYSFLTRGSTCDMWHGSAVIIPNFDNDTYAMCDVFEKNWWRPCMYVSKQWICFLIINKDSQTNEKCVRYPGKWYPMMSRTRPDKGNHPRGIAALMINRFSSELLKFTQVWSAPSYHEQSFCEFLLSDLLVSLSPFGTIRVSEEIWFSSWYGNSPVFHRCFMDPRCWFWCLPSPFWCHCLSVGCRTLSRGESQGTVFFLVLTCCCFSCISRSCTYCKYRCIVV